MAFEEDLALFTAASDFGVQATLAGAAVEVIFDAPGAEALGGDVVTTEPSVLVAAGHEPAVNNALVLAAGDLPLQLAQHAGSYTIRTLSPEPPDGAFVRCFLAKVS